jgi:nifR3 family TIM-barrel protein
MIELRQQPSRVSVEDAGEDPTIRIGNRTLATRYFLAPLAGYTHLAFRRVVRECGGVGLATTDLVQAAHLVSGTRWARELVATHPDDAPLSVQIYGGVAAHLVEAAQWLEGHGYAAVDINMGCPMAKITGQGGGARLMCDTDGACGLVRQVVEAVKIPVTVKMRLGWDRERISAPALAREFEQLGVAAITIHGRTRAQGFRGAVDLDGIRAVVEAVEQIPVVGNGDVRTPADAWRMREVTGCAAVAIGRGALFDPWIFRRLQLAQSSPARKSRNTCNDSLPTPATNHEPTAAEQITFLSRHFQLMVEQHGEFQSCRMFRKFAAWSGARLGIPEDLENRLRRFESVAEFDQIVEEIRARHGARRDSRPTAEIRVPNGPVEYW